MSKRKYDFSERLIWSWGTMHAGLAKTVVISAVALSTVVYDFVFSGNVICQWNCFAAMVFAVARMAFTITSVGVAGSVSPVRRDVMPLFTEITSIQIWYSVMVQTVTFRKEALGTCKASFLHNTTTGVNTIFVGPGSYHAPGEGDNHNRTIVKRDTESITGNHADAMAEYYCLTFAGNSGCPLNQNALHGEMYFNGYGGIDNYCNNDDDDSYNSCGSGSGLGAMATGPWDEGCWECGITVDGHK
ncbi:hypothetical protein V1509DRAFT_660334 [Lipomyces kononenkoae]